MKTQKEVRDSFWNEYNIFRSERKACKTQNDYNATIRCAFVAYVDLLAKDGIISEKLASRVTL